MKRFSFWLGIFGLIFLACQPGGTQTNTAALMEEGRQLSKQFMGELKRELQLALKAGGPLNAIRVCQKRAPEIARKLSLKSGWHLKRTSLRVRNPKNAPDAWERRVLKKFTAEISAGRNLHTLEYGEVVVEDGKRVFRYAKAIPTGKICLMCHGAKIRPALRRKILELYPEDKAVGFREGELRGIFSLKKVLDWCPRQDSNLRHRD